MQHAAARVTDDGRDERPPPRPAPTYLRTRRSVLREAGGREGVESVAQLAIAAQAGRRAPWSALVVTFAKFWQAPVSMRMLLQFLGWVLEGSVRPRWANGGLIALDAVTRTVIGSLETRDAVSGKLVPGAWAGLLRCSAKQARRTAHVAVALGLVEQVRNRRPERGALSEAAAAYVPTRKLLDWLLTREVPADFQNGKIVRPPEAPPSPLGDGGASCSSADPPEVGHIEFTPRNEAPSVAELRSVNVDVGDGSGFEAAASVGEKPEQRAVGTVGGARAAAPEGENGPARGLRLVPASVSASPAAPPAGEPPGALQRAPDDPIRQVTERFTSAAAPVDPGELRTWIAQLQVDQVRRELAEEEGRRQRLHPREVDRFREGMRVRAWSRWVEFWRQLGDAVLDGARGEA